MFRFPAVLVITWMAALLCVGDACAQERASPPSSPAACPTPARVALDIGHTLARPGATSARGATEFTFNQRLGQAVAGKLVQAGVPTTVIGASGAPISLLDRTRQARGAGATLFLSLHHDSVQPRYLTEWQVDGRTLRYSDNFHGYSLFVSQSNGRPQDSIRFASLLGQSLNASGFVPSLHHAEPIPGEGRPLLDARIGLYRFDDLIVLRSATMPAVLLEAGVIVNRDEETRLLSQAVLDRMASAIAAAVRRYCPS